MLVEIKILDLRGWWEVTPRDFGDKTADRPNLEIFQNVF